MYLSFKEHEFDIFLFIFTFDFGICIFIEKCLRFTLMFGFVVVVVVAFYKHESFTTCAVFLKSNYNMCCFYHPPSYDN